MAGTEKIDEPDRMNDAELDDNYWTCPISFHAGLIAALVGLKSIAECFGAIEQLIQSSTTECS